MKLYGPFCEIVTMDGLSLHGPLQDHELPVIRNAGIVVQDGKVLDIGGYHQLFKKYAAAERVLTETKHQVVVPAFIDCHTHICWAGNRANDYAMRVSGKSYLEIAKAGGGIMDTVLATRSATQEELVTLILKRTESLLAQGVAIVEVKSGYGLDLDNELKMLRAIKETNNHTSAKLIPTFLGAHIRPKDFEGTHKKYLAYLVNEVAPRVLEEGLAKRADIFVEEGAFDIELSEWYIKEMQKLGFEMTVHADQFSSGGASLAVETGCISADHLESIDEHSITKFRNSKTVAIALPGASLGLGMAFTPCRQLLDNDACVAIATDWNPGSAPMGHLLAQASIIGANEKMSIAETLAAITYRSAYALRVNAGTIRIGDNARFTVYEGDDFRNIFYSQGQLHPTHTIIGDECIQH
ncbi:MAG: imidazolonepropionase [Balneola sp.]|nr:MAG: imidazolonepropionase [Balneola sp.]